MKRMIIEVLPVDPWQDEELLIPSLAREDEPPAGGARRVCVSAEAQHDAAMVARALGDPGLVRHGWVAERLPLPAEDEAVGASAWMLHGGITVVGFFEVMSAAGLLGYQDGASVAVRARRVGGGAALYIHSMAKRVRLSFVLAPMARERGGDVYCMEPKMQRLSEEYGRLQASVNGDGTDVGLAVARLMDACVRMEYARERHECGICQCGKGVQP